MRKRSRSSSPSGDEAAPRRRAAAAVARDLEEHADLITHKASSALCLCILGVCPWCVLRSKHGDLRDALVCFHRRTAEIESSHGSKARFILRDCREWIIDLVAADRRSELHETSDSIGSLQSGTTTGSGGVWGKNPYIDDFLRFSVHDTQSAAADSSAQMTSSGATSSSSQRATALPLVIAQHANLSMLACASAMTGGTLRTVNSTGVVWQWRAGGRRKSWRDYDDFVCATLNQMVASGEEKQMFLIEKEWYYEINVATKTQTSMTNGTQRRIRVRPSDAEG